jgi:hypothetical protein
VPGEDEIGLVGFHESRVVLLKPEEIHEISGGFDAGLDNADVVNAQGFHPGPSPGCRDGEENLLGVKGFSTYRAKAASGKNIFYFNILQCYSGAGSPARAESVKSFTGRAGCQGKLRYLAIGEKRRTRGLRFAEICHQS